MKKSSGKNIDSLNSNTNSIVKSWRRRVDHDLSLYKTSNSKRCEEISSISILEKEIQTLTECQEVIQIAAEEVEKRVHRQIATVVSRCLSSVFGTDAYEFQIKFEKKRGKTDAVLVFCRDGQYVDPLTAAGGGVVDIASFALRVTCILCAVPKLRKLCLLDEPFRHLAPELRPIAIQLLKELSVELGVQFIIVSHFAEDELELIGKHGKIIRLGKK